MFLAKVVFAILVIIGIGFYLVKRYSHSQMHSGTVIILNGPSGSEKTSIQKEFQKLMMPHLWVKVGIDTLFDRVMPDITPENMNFWQSQNLIRWIETGKDAEWCKVVTLFTGREGERVAYGMNSAIAAYAANGCDVIVDYIAYKSAWIEDLRNKLKSHKTYYVAVDIPLDILEQREAARGTSPVGHGRSHYDMVYGDIAYDLRVDSHKQSAYEIAEQLQGLVKR